MIQSKVDLDLIHKWKRFKHLACRWYFKKASNTFDERCTRNTIKKLEDLWNMTAFI